MFQIKDLADLSEPVKRLIEVIAEIDSATIVAATPTVLAGPHPYAAYAAFLTNALRPKTKFLSIIGSYGWGGKTVETLAGMIPDLKVEVIDRLLLFAVHVRQNPNVQKKQPTERSSEKSMLLLLNKIERSC